MSRAWHWSAPASLLDTCLGALADNIERVEHLSGISEELALALFDDVLRLGKLSPKVRTWIYGRTCTGADRPGQGIRAVWCWISISGVMVVSEKSP